MLWLALYLPELALEALPGAADRPRAAFGAVGGTVLQAVNAIAARAGVNIGMGAAAALALCPDIDLVARSPAAEAALRDALLIWAGQFTSHCSALTDDCLVLEIGASRRLFGGIEALLDRLRADLVAFGQAVQMATAPTPAAAALLARHRPGMLVQTPDALPAVLGPLPLAYLNLAPRLTGNLHALGLRSIGDCRRLPRAELGRRLGPALLAVLDRLLGIAPEPLVPFCPPPEFRRALELPAPVHAAPQLLPALMRLLLELRGFLRTRQRWAQTLCLDLVCADGPPVPVLLRLSTATGDTSIMQELFVERLQQTVLPGPVVSLLLCARDLAPVASAGQDLFDSPDGEPLAVLVDRLRARLGEAAVTGISATADHRPERAWRYCAIGDGQAALSMAARPAWLLRVPQRLRVVAGMPCLDGRLTLLDGPERIEGGWWDSADVARDYYIACQRTGRRLWIYQERRPAGGWYLHGLFA